MPPAAPDKSTLRKFAFVSHKLLIRATSNLNVYFDWRRRDGCIDGDGSAKLRALETQLLRGETTEQLAGLNELPE